jgi:hypothetical protein
MSVRNYNGSGRWSVEAVQQRYAEYAQRYGVEQRSDLTPHEHWADGHHWIYPIMDCVIEGIKRGDPACVEIGVEFIEESASFRFGRTLKSKTARALRRAALTGEQKERIRKRVVEMLRAGYLPREYREYVKLARQIGLGEWTNQLERGMDLDNPRVRRYYEYLRDHAIGEGQDKR